MKTLMALFLVCALIPPALADSDKEEDRVEQSGHCLLYTSRCV